MGPLKASCEGGFLQISVSGGTSRVKPSGSGEGGGGKFCGQLTYWKAIGLQRRSKLGSIKWLIRYRLDLKRPPSIHQDTRDIDM